MDTVKLILDILSGIVIPLAVAGTTFLWHPTEDQQKTVREYLVSTLWVLLLLIGCSALVVGVHYGFYSKKPPDPLAALTEQQKVWLTHYLQRSENPKTILKEFFFNEDRRFLFITGRDIYEIQQFRGSSLSSNLMAENFDLPVTQQTSSAKHEPKMQFYDAASRRPLSVTKKSIEPFSTTTVPDGKEDSSFFSLNLSVPRNFNVLLHGTFEHSASSPGTVDSIVVPLQRYSGGYSLIRYDIFFDIPVETAGLYDVVKRGDNDCELTVDGLQPEKITDSRIATVKDEGLILLEGLEGSDMVRSKIATTQWNAVFKFTILPKKAPSALSFQFIRNDD